MTRDYEKLLRAKMLLVKVQTLLSETSGEVISPEEKKALIDSVEIQTKFLELKCDKFSESR
jgi:hypothetical protein